MPHYTDAEKQAMMKTARSGGAVSGNAILPRVVREQVLPVARMLDYGAGPKAIHTVALREEGYNVLAHDINPQKTSFHIDTNINHGGYFRVVFASNVLNVQPSAAHVRDVVRDVYGYMGRYARAFFNYPVEPRKNDLTVSDIDGILKEHFQEVERVTVLEGKKLTTPVWKCSKGG